METGNCWENDDGTISIVKTEPEDVLSIEYDENGTNEQSEFTHYGNDENHAEGPQQYGESLQEGFQFKQEGMDTGEDMEYRMESYQDEEYYPSEDADTAAPSHLGYLENFHYRKGCNLPETDQGDFNQPGTSDMSTFADAREEQLYPCRYCEYVGNHPRLLSSHMNNRHTKSVVYQCPHCPYNSTISKSTRDHVDTKHCNEDDKPIDIKRKCQFCDYSASNATVLKNHMNKHTGEKQHQCSFCDFHTLWEGYLKMHIRRKHGDQTMDTGNPAKEYPCQYCDYKALTPSSLKLHTNKHTREQEHQCPYCPYKTVWTTYIKLHIKNKHLKEKSPASKEFACNFCDYKAKNTTLLKQHENKHTREKVNQCPHCPFTTLWITYMKLHIKRKHAVKIEGENPEKREFPCKYCSYKAISGSHLKIHENKHTKAVEYKCQQCDFKTTWYGYLKLHTKRKHSVKEEKSGSKTSYPCNYCPYKAINLSTLKVHQNKHTREVLYNCPHCEFKTTWGAYIKMHIEKHNVQNFKTRKQDLKGVKSFPCEYCDYVATQNGSLKQHINSKHTRETLHKCPKCDYQCAVYGNLKMHIRRRHGLKPDPDGKYRCKECEFISDNSNNFKLHLNEKHDIKLDVDEIKLEDDKVYSCHFCSYQTLYPQVMKKHVNKHTRQNVIQCPHCPYKTVWNHYMKVHIRRHNEPKLGRQRFTKPNTDLNRLFPCQFCDHRSLSFSSLKDHINSVHTREVLHSCPYCDHKCTLKGNLRGHIRRKHPAEFVENEKRYSCEHCDFKTSIIRNLKVHLKREHNIDDTKVKAENGEFQCQYCEYKARSYYALKIHTNKHTKENSYHCPQCEFVTRWPNYLSKHIKQHSLNKRKVTCLYCDYKGCSTFRLRKHVESLHKKDQYYPCPKPKCDFKTMHYPSLRIHLKGSIHADSRRKSNMSVSRNFSYKYEPNEGRYFACDHCDYASKTQGNLDLHIKNKHDKRVILRCNLCNYKTPSKTYFNRHFKIKHSLKKEETDELKADNIIEYKVKDEDENMSSTVDDSMLTTEYDSTLPAKDDTNEESINDAEEDKNSTVMKRCRRQTNSIPFYLEEQTDDEENVTSDVETEHSANQKENLETQNDDQDEISLKIGQQKHKEIQKNVAKTNFVHKTKGRRRQKQTKLRNVEKETKEEVKIKTEDTVESEKTEASLKKNPEQMQIEDDVGTNEAENMLTNKNESTEYNSQQSTQVSLNVEHEKKEKPSRNIEDECITNKIESNLSFKQTRNGIIDSVQDDLLINQNVSEMSIDMKDCDHNKHAIEDKLDAGKNGIKSVETEKMLLIKKGSHVGVIEDDTKCNKGNPDNKTLLQDNLVQSNVKSASKSEKPQQQISVPKRIPKKSKKKQIIKKLNEKTTFPRRNMIKKEIFKRNNEDSNIEDDEPLVKRIKISKSKTYEKVTSSEKTLPKRRSRVKRISNCIKDTNEENKLKKNINSDETIEDISETNNSLVLEEKIKTSTTKQVEAVVEHNQVEEENKNLIISEPLDGAATTVDDSNIEQKGNSNNTDTIEGNQTEDKMSSAENNEEVTNFSQQKSNTGSNIELSHSEQEITPSVKENKNILLENVS